MIKDILERFPVDQATGKPYATLSHATVNLADMGEKTITTQVKIDGSVVPDFSQDWEVEFQGEKYIMPLRQPQGAKENTSLNSTIDLTFQHWAIYQLKRWMFFTVQPVETDTAVADKYIADVILNLGDFCNLFGQVLRHYYGDTITIDLNDDPDTGWQYKKEATPISINHSYIWDVLIKLYELFAVRWSIEPNGDSSHYVIKVGYPAKELDHPFEYGFVGGLLKVERQVQSEDIRNMLLGRGGEKNIPKYYFKKSPDEEKWRSDPDWIEELANIYFTNLMPATFRSYVQGWKAAHIAKYPGYAAVGESNAYAPWAYRKGYTVSRFDPVEFVKDDESIAKYGELWGGLENNEDIYPTIQGATITGLGRIDEVVAVEEITSDDVEESVDNDASIIFFRSWNVTAMNVAPGRSATASQTFSFSVEEGHYKDLFINPIVLKAYKPGEEDLLRTNDAEVSSYSITVVPADGGEPVSASGIPPGNYLCTFEVEVKNLTTNDALNITAGDEHSALMSATSKKQWSRTWNIWVKNLWTTQKGLAEDGTVIWGETDEEYAERVWRPILGDRNSGKAKVMFSTGSLSLSDDYEFTIVDIPEYDTSQEFKKTDDDGNIIATYSSHWRITLGKSDAELESTGLYLPNKKQHAVAGDCIIFIGTEPTHKYTVLAEVRLDDYKKDALEDICEIKPTWVVSIDRVRLNSGGIENGAIQQLVPGGEITLYDSRFIPDAHTEKLYIQSLTYTYREPSKDDAALNPDVQVVLSDKYETLANPVSVLQGDVKELQKQLGSISNVEQIVRRVGDTIYLRKDGMPDRSQSPTRFYSLLTSGNFRSGIIGGTGWGFYKNENGDWVCEADCFKARKDFEVNNLVINQAAWRGGMIVESAAEIEVTSVVDSDLGYECYFDQKGGTVANLFQEDDVAYCNRFTADNNELKFYKRRVVAVSANSITLTKGYTPIEMPDGTIDTGVNGSGVPAEKDVIIHFGNYTKPERRYVKVRDVVGGGYERYIENLDSVNAPGTEYYFVGRQSGLYGGAPRWFVGDENGYAKYENREFIVKAKLSVESTVGETPLDEYISGKIPLSEVGGANLLLNSDFADGFDGWAYTKGYVDIRPGAEDGTPRTVQIIASGAESFTWAGITQGPTEYLSASPGENMIASLYAHGDPSSFDKDAWLEVWFYGNDKAPLATLSSLGEKITPTDSLRRRVVYKFKTPGGTAYVGVKIYIQQNGRLFVDSLKVERGTIATDWTPSPVDQKKRLKSFDYLKAALKERTTIDGGLIQSSLLALGYTGLDGAFHIMAGTNGKYDSDNLRGKTIAAWWGGSMVDLFDADGNFLADPPVDAAKALVRMDGSGYLAGGAIYWGTDGKLHADPLSFFVGEEYVGLHLSLFQFVPGTSSNIASVDYVIPQAPFSRLMIGTRGASGLIEWDSENECFLFKGSVCATGNIIGYQDDGSGSSGGGGASFGLMRQWPSTAPGVDTTDALGANLGYELLTRLSTVESDYVSADTVELLIQELTDGIDGKFVQSLEVRAGKLVWTKNGVDHSITVPYATSAATAATLSTARRIWGQNFKGDGNVSGRWDLDGTGNQLSIYWDDTTAAPNIQSWASKPLIINKAGNNVGIGNIAVPAAKLHVAGTLRAGLTTVEALHMASSALRCQFSTGTGDNQLLSIDGASLSGGVATWRCAILRAGIDGHIAFGASYPLTDYQVYITENLRVRHGITVDSGQYIYLNESHTAWLRYNSTGGYLETNCDLVSQGDLIAFKG